MPRLSTTISTLAVAATLALPGGALADTAPPNTKPSCSSVAASVATAKALTSAQQADVERACEVRDGKIAPARAKRQAAAKTARTAVAAANQAYRAALAAAAQLPAGPGRVAALQTARTTHRSAVQAARSARRAVQSKARQEIHAARVEFRAAVKAIVQG